MKLNEAVLKTATAIDSFYGSERYAWSENKTRVTVLGDSDWIDNHGWEFHPRVRLNLSLPGLDERIRVAVNEVQNDSAPGGTSVDDDTQAAIRWVGSAGKKSGISYDLGLSSYGDSNLQAFGRLNIYLQHAENYWNTRLQNRLYWYTESKWRNDLRMYLERSISDRFFIRSRTRFDYSEEKSGQWYPSQVFTLFHKINNRTVIAWEALAETKFFDDVVFDQDEFLRSCEPKCRTYSLRTRFRQNIGFPWLFYELWPILAWPEARDFELTPAIRFRLEIMYGDLPKEIKLREE